MQGVIIGMQGASLASRVSARCHCRRFRGCGQQSLHGFLVHHACEDWRRRRLQRGHPPTWLMATATCSTATCVWMAKSPRNDGAHS